MGGVLASMTGFGHATGLLSDRFNADVRLTTLNSRFLEVVLRVFPRMETAELEVTVRSVITEQMARGKVVVTVELRPSTERAAPGLRLSWDVAQALLDELGRRPAGLELAPLALRDLLALPGFVEGGQELRLEEDEVAALLRLIGAARSGAVERRREEAAALLAQILAELGELEEFTAWLKEVNGRLRELLTARVRERLTAAVGGLIGDERIVAEAALLADRADVSEEVERLTAHLAHFRGLLAAGGAVGKKIDFLLQELLREVNTAGSKCREAGMGERVVGAKAALEKIREQCANLE
jgi:uncharacterized protein (TIGR00255 family)